MRFRGNLLKTARNEDGELTLLFAIDDAEVDIPEGELDITVKKYRAKRSNDANAYFWKLCTEIAKAIKSDKDTVYLLQLSKYGTYTDVEILTEAFEDLKRAYRYVEQIGEEYKGKVVARCYVGSSLYNTQEMTVLIDGTVQDAKDLGIQTWTPDEIAEALSVWEARYE